MRVDSVKHILIRRLGSRFQKCAIHLYEIQKSFYVRVVAESTSSIYLKASVLSAAVIRDCFREFM